MPHLVEMRKKHAKDGLTVLTVNVDNPEDRERALAFLRGAQIALPNYAVDPLDRAWADQLADIIFPHVRIYNREGKLIHEGTTPHDELEEKVEVLLKK